MRQVGDLPLQFLDPAAQVAGEIRDHHSPPTFIVVVRIPAAPDRQPPMPARQARQRPHSPCILYDAKPFRLQKAWPKRRSRGGRGDAPSLQLDPNLIRREIREHVRTLHDREEGGGFPLFRRVHAGTENTILHGRACSRERVFPRYHDFIYRAPRDPSARSAKFRAQSGNSLIREHISSMDPKPTGGSQTTSSWISVSGL